MFKRTNNNHEYEFLPAVLEVQDSPPSPIGRAVIWSVVLLVVITVVWACVGQVDIVATAQGKIITAGNIKTIQPLEIGVVKEIYVQEGQQVKKGEPLVALDSTNSSADKSQLENELRQARLAIQRHKVLATLDFTDRELAYNINQIAAIDGISDDGMETHRQLLQSEVNGFKFELSSLYNQIKSKEAELAATQNMVVKFEKTLPIVSQRAASLKNLSDKGLSPELVYLEVEETRISQEQDLAAQQHRLAEIGANIKAINDQISALTAEIKKERYTKISELNQKITAIEKELQKTNNRQQLQLLTSPVDGVVNQMEINTIGGIVTPAQPIMTIVPRNKQLEVEAWVANKDIGFVEKGQAAEVKVEAFPFTKYGVLDAEVVNLSFDAVPDEERGLIYKAKLSLQASVIGTGDKLINLVPGMNVTVEIKTGKRYLIEYILSPLMQYQDESIKER
ncbi:MAG: HlyD family type I secretion periplasmic adaptor subunit [Thiotrichaceae bacterium]|nr:HlyD family type I secretion periplasmic adaptor subunit [Thiotrichaceae bacterium]MBL1261343.1 HlyD family type I secretion periplasmic adaptor subunit [Thiotrichaceae bacterium]